MFKHILVPLDGSALAEQALPIAARLAHASGGSVTLLSVISLPIGYADSSISMAYTSTNLLEEALEADLADTRRYLEAVATSNELEGVQTQIEIQTGVAASVILSFIAKPGIDLVVISSHGYTGFKQWMFGSVARKIVHHSPVPVLVLRNSGTLSPGPRPSYMEGPLRILVPLDGSVIAKAALAPALHLIAALASPGQAAIHLLRVVKHQPGERLDAEAKERLLHKAKTYLQSVTAHVREELAAQLKGAVTWSVAFENDVAATIIRVAENGEDAEGAGIFGGCDFIALSTHGRGSFQRWVIGSVTERVLTGTRSPILVVRPQQVGSEQEIREGEIAYTKAGI